MKSGFYSKKEREALDGLDQSSEISQHTFSNVALATLHGEWNTGGKSGQREAIRSSQKSSGEK